MNLNNTIYLVFIIAVAILLGTAKAPGEIKQIADNTKVIITAGGLETIKINGQVVSVRPVDYSNKADAQEEKKLSAPIVEVKPTPEAPKVIEPVKTDDIDDGPYEYRSLVMKYFPADQWQNALRIMSAENGLGDPARISKPNKDKYKSVDVGLFQINFYWHKARVGGDITKLQDADTNARIASEIWKEQGWRPWSTAKKLGLK